MLRARDRFHIPSQLRFQPIIAALLVAFATAIVCTPSTGFAQDEDRAALETARDHMERGQQLYLQQRYVEAADAFQQAFAARPFAAFHYNTGVAYENAGQPGQAAEYFTRYLEQEPRAGDRTEVLERIERLRAEALAVSSAPPGTDPPVTPPVAAPDPEEFKSLLSIQTEPAGATITLRQNGEVAARGTSPFASTLDPGDYDVTVEHPDFRTVENRVSIRAGKVYVVIVEMSQGQFLGYLRVVTQPPGAQVFIDDREEGAVGTTPFQNVLATGEHRIWIERPGYEVQEHTVNIGLGETINVDAELERVTYGRIRVLANQENAVVRIDGERVGTVPWEGDVPAGEHRVTVSYSGMKDWSERITVERGQRTPVRVRLRPAPSRSGAWVTTVMSAAFLSGGLVLGLQARGLESDLRRDRNNGLLASNDSRLLRGRIYSISADIAFGLGGLLGVLSLYYFLRDPLPDSEGRIQDARDWTFTPTLSPREAGAQLQWSF